MILFIILAIIALVLVAFMVLVIGIGGGIATILFSDVIVCIAIIGFLLYKFIKRKK